ncbi:MAG: hypothetical protein ACTSWX_10780, partial [Promethearchaeota archaeon]
EEVSAPVEEEVSAPVEEEVPIPVEEEVPIPVEEEVPIPVEEEVSVPVKSDVSLHVEEETSDSIEDIMKAIKKTTIANLTLKPVKTPEPIKNFDISDQKEEILESADMISEENAGKKLENEIKNIIEQQTSEDKIVKTKPIEKFEEHSIPLKEQVPPEDEVPKEISPIKSDNKQKNIEKDLIENSKKKNMGYNFFGVPNRVMNNETPKKGIESPQEIPQIQKKINVQKSSLSRRRRRNSTLAKRTKTKVEICPMCGKLNCICGYMQRVKK